MGIKKGEKRQWDIHTSNEVDRVNKTLSIKVSQTEINKMKDLKEKYKVSFRQILNAGIKSIENNGGIEMKKYFNLEDCKVDVEISPITKIEDSLILEITADDKRFTTRYCKVAFKDIRVTAYNFRMLYDKFELGKETYTLNANMLPNKLEVVDKVDRTLSNKETLELLCEIGFIDKLNEFMIEHIKKERQNGNSLGDKFYSVPDFLKEARKFAGLE